MRVLLISFVAGLGVGILYGLIRVKSPAPPIVALLGLLGMVIGEQFWIWVQTKKLDISHTASVCLVGERYDRPHRSANNWGHVARVRGLIRRLAIRTASFMCYWPTLFALIAAFCCLADLASPL